MLMEKLRLVKASVGGTSFITRDQGVQGIVADFADELKKLFVQAYPNEPTMSAILLQSFLSGLRTPIRRQLLLRGKPELLENTMKDAHEVEYALEFKTGGQKPDTINAVAVKQKDKSNELLQQTLESAYGSSRNSIKRDAR